jgi:hypothetical protein
VKIRNLRPARAAAARTSSGLLRPSDRLVWTWQDAGRWFRRRRLAARGRRAGSVKRDLNSNGGHKGRRCKQNPLHDEDSLIRLPLPRAARPPCRCAPR